MQILTAQELHNLAMNIVGDKLEKMGYEFQAFLKKHTIEVDSLLNSGMDEWYTMDYLYKKYVAEAELMRPFNCLDKPTSN